MSTDPNRNEETSTVSDRSTGPRDSDYALDFTVRLDNYEPPRQIISGQAKHYPGDDLRAETITLPLDELPDGENAVYLLDDGTQVTAWYAAGWSQTERVLHIQPMPTNPNQRRRPDNGRLVDFTTWMLGPRRAYHLKTKRAS